MVVITPEHYNRIVRLLDHKVPVKLELEVKNATGDDEGDCYNVIANIPGAGPHKDEIVMVGGHLDSWQGGTGATDNGVGSAVMLEVIRVLRALNLKLDRTVRIGLWGGEEEGLFGSREYVKKLTAPYAARIRLNTPVASLQRQPHQVVVRLKSGSLEHFDQVFIACHSDQALQLLSDASHEEREILGAIRYQSNAALLHTDTRLMPQRPLARAAWNYHLPIDQYERVTVTYNMNILQTLDAPVQFLLTLNRSDDVDPRKVLGRYDYDHPVYTSEAVAAQARRHEINGVRRTYYCGAYWSYGFHEDGVKSALVALEEFRRREGHAQPHLQRVG